jgi:hypothetical protein
MPICFRFQRLDFGFQTSRTEKARGSGDLPLPLPSFLFGFGSRPSLRVCIWFRISGCGFPCLFRVSLALLLLLALSPVVLAQPRPYIGFVYPAGGQQGTTLRIRLGGQNLDDVSGVLVTGRGVSAKLAENYRRLNNQEMQLVNEQLRVLRREVMSESARAEAMMADGPTMMSENSTNTLVTTNAVITKDDAARALIDRIEKRTAEYVPNPACAAIASLVLVDITIASDAQPAEREVRLVTLRGLSNPLPFHVGQFAESSKRPMVSAIQQVLGKEAQALRKRSPGEDEEQVTIPCTVNGQIASGEVNRYRFQARKGQRLVITTLGRQLVPFIADAVPGWFQPVLALYDADGKELAYDDDYRFRPDPTLFYEVPKDGEYAFSIRDSLYRGREDFVYRITVGELPFITSIFPLGAQAGAPAEPKIKGWNVEGAQLAFLPSCNFSTSNGIQSIVANRKRLVSNRVPFAIDTLPEALEHEPNNSPADAQKVTLPIVLNGRIDRLDDWDVYQFVGKSNDQVVAEVQARCLDSPLDSLLKLTDAVGNLLALNDDHEELGAGLNTHHADSCFLAKLPADGSYFVHVGDTARQGGDEYAYRLRLSAPQPGFELRVVPSSLGLRSKSSGTLNVYAMRQEGFTGPVKLSLRNPPAGFSALPVTLAGTQTVARLIVKTDLAETEAPVDLSVCGKARVGEREIAVEAVPAEDKMQAFLWRHLVPAQDLKVLVFNPGSQPAPKRIPRPRPPRPALTNAPAVSNARAGSNAVALSNGVLTASRPATNIVAGTNSVPGTNSLAATNTTVVPERPRFTKQQIAGRLRQLKLLFEEQLLTDDFYNEKVAELEDAQ